MPNESLASATADTVLPKQVLSRFVRANTLQAEQRSTAGQPPTPAPSQDAAPSPSPPVAAPAAPAPPTPPTPNPEDLEAIGVAPGDPRAMDPGYLVHRIRTVSGMLRSSRERYEGELAAARGQIGASESRSAARVAELERQVAELQSQIATAKPIEIRPEKYMRPEAIEELGPERTQAILEANARMSREFIAEAIERELKPERERRAKEAQEREQESGAQFVRALDNPRTGFPAWREVNGSEGWKQWLMQRDESTGHVRDRLLKMAEAERNPEPIVILFKQYEQTLRAPGTANAPAPMPPTLSSAGAQPGGASALAGDAPTGGDGEILDARTIQATYASYTKRKAPAEEVAAFDARVAKASREGRIRR